MPTPHDQRHLILEGAFNMRDLGGVPTADGYQVRTGKLFRADALHNLTTPDLEILRAYGIASVVDLRMEAEVTQFGKARLTDHGARHIHLPLLDSDPLLPEGVPLPDNFGEMYAIIAMKWPERFVRVMEALSSLDNMPAVFHCAAGKDRTGITAAFIYSVLDVDREEIIADYVLTDANMAGILAAERQNAQPQPDDWVSYPANYDRAVALTIRTFLDALDARYGSPVEWLRQSGLRDNSIDALRRGLLA